MTAAPDCSCWLLLSLLFSSPFRSCTVQQHRRTLAHHVSPELRPSLVVHVSKQDDAGWCRNAYGPGSWFTDVLLHLLLVVTYIRNCVFVDCEFHLRTADVDHARPTASGSQSDTLYFNLNYFGAILKLVQVFL